jgi:hypothetical protein
LVTFTLIRSVVTGVKFTVRLTRLLPETAAPMFTHADPFQLCSWKAVMPHWVNVSVFGGSTGWA